MAVLLVLDTSTAEWSSSIEGRIRQVDPGAPHVNVLDLGVTRGDGIFESFGVIRGVVQAVDPHLDRLSRSAAILELPQPDTVALRAAVLRAVDLHPPVPEMVVKLVVTRGIEGSNMPTTWVYAREAADFSKARRVGISVATLDRGYRHDVTVTSPWLLQGAKTLSYAVNMAALREAERRSAADVIFISSDDFVLEGPTSTVVAQFGRRIVTPRTDRGVLPGTTQAAAFEYFASEGCHVVEDLVRSRDLQLCDSLWLLSSGRLIVPVTVLDGVPRKFDEPLTAAVLSRLLGRKI